MIVSRRRVAGVLAGSVLVVSALATGALGAGLASAAPDATACINALRADRASALQLTSDWIATYNSTATGSALAKANANELKYLKLSRDDYFKAYQYAYKGQKTSANTWIKKGNDAIALANKAVTAYNAEVAKINASAAKNSTAADTLDTQITATDETCLGL
jgi:hypothetical protein